MKYRFVLKNKKLDLVAENLIQKDFREVSFFYDGLTKENIDIIINKYFENKLVTFFDEGNFDHFLLFIFDPKNNKFLAFNDKFGSNEIYCFEKDNNNIITNDIVSFFKKKNIEPKINQEALKELLFFQSIIPPRTIYKKVVSVPIASYLEIHLETLNMKINNYWNIHKLFENKEKKYKDLIIDIRKALLDNLVKVKDKIPTVSLSGGIDSGGLLGMLKSISTKPASSITVGAYGPNSFDLKSSRRTAIYNKSINYEIYPKINDIEKIIQVSKGLNQPIEGSFIIPNSLILEKAKKIGSTDVVFGFGAEMLLGNLKISKASDILSKIEKIIPSVILTCIYRILGKLNLVSENQLAFLLAVNNWPKRFIYARGTLREREEFIFKNKNESFLDSYISKMNNIMKLSSIGLVDKIVIFYFYSWVNYLQTQTLNILSKKYLVNSIIPFDSINVIKKIFKTSDVFRKKKN